MSRLVDSSNTLARWVGESFVSDDVGEIHARLVEYNALDDAELQRRCRDALHGNEPVKDAEKKPLRHALSLLVKPFGWQSYDASIDHIALAATSFSRAPADLPHGARMYPEQIRAAVALAQRSLIQMNTGEGKTYALLPTAFALACRYTRVYIVCANEYLAWRDARRTLPFWKYVGLTPGLCTKARDSDERWSARVVYTTLGALLFKSMLDETAPRAPSAPLTFGAVILDEADAILLDQADQPFHVVVPVRSNSFDWTFATEFAQQLQEDEHIIVEGAQLSASLTVRGEELLKAELDAHDQRTPYFLARFAVENSYVALRVVKEDVHYVVEDNALYPIDPVTSQILRSQTNTWLLPLEFHKGMPPRSRQIPIHASSPREFLNAFDHMSGLSGTIEDDSLEYLYSYRLPTLAIKPRFPKQEDLWEDLVFKTKKAAVETLVEEVLETASDGQPVLVGTQSIADAQEIYNALRAGAPPAVRLHFLTGKNERDAAKIFERAGEVGSVIVSTQLAGRGVDIRLEEEAKANGGLALFSLGRALEMRHDKQFLGRAGRHGDPFTAQFICSFEDRLLREFGGERMQKVIDRIGLEDDVPLESRVITSSIARAQRTRRNHRIRQRFTQEYIAKTQARTTSAMKVWFEYLQIENEDKDPAECASAFLTRTVDHFIEHTVQPFFHGGDVTPEEAKNAVQTINDALGWARQPPPLTPEDIEDRRVSVACQDIRARVLGELREVTTRRRRRIEETRSLRDDRNAWLEGWKEVYYLMKEMAPGNQDNGAVESSGVDESSDDGPTFDPSEIDDLALAGSSRTFSRTEVADTIAELRGCLESVVRPPEELVAQVRGLQSAIREEPLPPSEWNEVTDDIDALLKHIVSVGHRIDSEMRSSYRDLALLDERTPRQIAFWRLRLVWRDFLDERERIRFLVMHEEHALLDRYQLIMDRTTEEWVKQEQELSGAVLRDLLHADQPQLLDELFFLEDNQVHSERSKSASEFTWNVSDVEVADPSDARSRAEDLIQQFIASHLNALDEIGLSVAIVRRLLKDFLRESPLTTLQTPVQIHRALQKWSRSETERQVSQRNRELRRTGLLRFLRYLRSIKVIGPLPNLGTRVKYSLLQLSRTMQDTSRVLATLGALSFLVLFLVGSYVFDGFGDAKQFGPLGTRVDDVLFGGMLVTGNVVAACFALPILINMLAALLNVDRSALSTGVISLVSSALMAWWLTNWGDSIQDLQLVEGMAAFIVIFLVLQASMSTINALRTHAGVDLTTGWLCYTSILVFALGLWAGDAIPPQIPLVLALVVLFAYGWPRLNKQEIVLVSERLTDVGSSALGSEKVTTSNYVLGGTSLRPHVFGILCAWLAYRLLTVLLDVDSAWVLAVVPASTYMLVLLVWTNATLKKRFSFALWQARLNNRRQRLKDAPSYDETRAYLQESRRKIQRREVLAQVAILLVVFVALFGTTVAGTRFPLSVALLFAGFLFAASSESLFTQLRNFFSNRSAFQVEEVDLAKLFEPEPEESRRIDKVARMFRNRIAPVFFAILAFGKLVLELPDLVEMVGRVSTWIQGSL